MKKLTFLSLSTALLIGIAFYMHADETKELRAEDVSVIRYTVTIYKDKEGHDRNAWEKTVRQVIDLDKEEITIDDICNTIKKTCSRTRKGIRGEIQISFGDGKCPEGCCGDNCTCLEKYNGTCPCSASVEKCRKSSCCSTCCKPNCCSSCCKPCGCCKEYFMASEEEQKEKKSSCCSTCSKPNCCSSCCKPCGCCKEYFTPSDNEKKDRKSSCCSSCGKPSCCPTCNKPCGCCK